MTHRILFLAALLTPVHAAGQGIWSLGAGIQGYVDFAPGNDYLTGFSLEYTDGRWFHRRPALRASYLTSRPEAAFRNVLRQDWFLISPSWNFRPGRIFDPIIQMDFGYQRYDLESDIFRGHLENKTWTLGCKAGLGLGIGKRYAIRYALGYQWASSRSSAIYPIPFALDAAVSLP